jgi:hypothetical protein
MNILQILKANDNNNGNKMSLKKKAKQLIQ